MHCTSCGAEIPEGARFCGSCGAAVASSSTSSVAQPPRSSRQIGCAVAAVVGLILLLVMCSGRAGETGPAADKPRSVDLAACQATLDAGKTLGIIKEQPSKTRVDVEELAWSRLAAKEKRNIVAAVDCTAYGSRTPGLSDAPAVVYGYRSGKRLALMAGGVPALE